MNIYHIKQLPESNVNLFLVFDLHKKTSKYIISNRAAAVVNSLSSMFFGVTWQSEKCSIISRGSPYKNKCPIYFQMYSFSHAKSTFP